MDSDGVHKAVVILSTIIMILLGSIFLFVSINKDVAIDPTIKELLHETGIALIGAGGIAIVVEIFLVWQMSQKIKELNDKLIPRMDELETRFKTNVVDTLISKAEEWSLKPFPSPIDKNSLDKVIRIGLDEWFKKEDFTLLNLNSAKISKKYHEERLEKLHGTVVANQTFVVTYVRKYASKNTNNLIEVRLVTDFKVINPETKNDIVDSRRYVNSLGVFDYSVSDIPSEIYEMDSEDIIKKIRKITLTYRQDGEKTDVEIILIKIKEEGVIQIIKNETIEEKKKRLMNENIPYDENKAYVFHFKRPEKQNQLKKFEYLLFVPRSFKPQESVTIHYERHSIYGANDFFLMATRTLTQELVIRLENFDKFETDVFPRLVGGASVSENTNKSLVVNDMMFADSVVLINWKSNL